MQTPAHWPKPSLGRIVHVHLSKALYNQEVIPAIVTGVEDDATIYVTLFPANKDPVPYPYGRVMHRDAKGAAKDFWSWPERV